LKSSRTIKSSLAALLLMVACGGPRFKAVEQQSEPIPSAGQTAFPPTPSTTEPTLTPEVSWTVLRGLNYRTGMANKAVEALNGTTVRLVGYMVPFEDELDETRTFLLVPSSGLCVHLPPPPPNQMVLVEVTSGGAAAVQWSKPVEVTGSLHLDGQDSPLGKASFRMQATAVEPDGG